MKRLIITLFIALAAAGCGARQAETSNTIYVTIQPLKGLVEAIVGDDFDIRVLVPEGAGPETYEPSAREFVELNGAAMIFCTGLIDFEKSLMSRVQEPDKVVALHHGIDLIKGSCSHGHTHAHGVDPHIWTSPKALMKMAENAHKALLERWTDSVKYTENHDMLQARLHILDSHVGRRIASSGVKRFIIYHPALTYYARDYGIEQVAIEHDGKEPSAKRLAALVRMAREERIRRILYQSQYPASTVEVLAGDIGGEAVAINPLAEDIIANINNITDVITAR